MKWIEGIQNGIHIDLIPMICKLQLHVQAFYIINATAVAASRKCLIYFAMLNQNEKPHRIEEF